MQPMTVLPPLADLAQLPWSAERRADAVAVAGPNHLRVAQAALALLPFVDDGPDFAAWCDAQASETTDPGRSPTPTPTAR